HRGRTRRRCPRPAVLLQGGAVDHPPGASVCRRRGAGLPLHARAVTGARGRKHTTMQRTADVVVIGGGIMGAGTAYHLAKRGCTDVTVLESGEMFGLGSTGLNAGGIRYQFATAVNIELSKLSIGMMERFADEMDQEVGLRRCGYLFMLDDEADLAQFTRNVAVQNAHGVPSRVVTTQEIAELAPEVELRGIIGGTWCPRDGLVDPNSLLQGFVSNARRLGATLETKAPATRIDVEDG